MPGPEVDRACEGLQRLVEPAEVGKGVAPVVVQDGFVGAQGQGLVVAGQGLLVAAQAGQADAPLAEVLGRRLPALRAP